MGPRAARAWWALALVLGLGAVMLAAWDATGAGSVRQHWDWQPALALSQPWRAFSAAWVHYSAGHLLANLAGLALLAWLGRRAGCGRFEALAWALAWPLTHLALVLQPALAHYGGLSGVLHAGVVVVAWRLTHPQPGDGPRTRWIGRLMLVALGLKLATEQPFGEPLRQWPGWDIPIAPLAHATGAASGLLCAMALCRIARDRATARGRWE